MSPRAARRVLFLALLLLAPLPMLGFDAVAPVARYLLLGAVCLGMRLVEGPGGVVWQLAALFFGHALAYGALLWAGAWLAARALAVLGSAARGAVVAIAVVAATLWALTAEPYLTPFGPAARANLVAVLQ